MKWQDVRRLHPNQWMLIEPKNPRTEGEQRVFEELTLHGHYDSADAAWKAYHVIHDDEPTREMFVFHADRDELDVRVRHRAALRRLA